MSVIAVDFSALERAAEQLRTTYGGIDESLSTLGSRLSAMRWQGEDRAAYEAHKARWDAAMRDLNTILSDVAQAVSGAREKYARAETETAKSWT